MTFKKKSFLFSFITLLYLCTCLIVLFYITPATDTLYYWDWGRHLAFSYFDGPPLVAYLFAAWSAVFGNSIISVNALSLASSFIIVWPIYLLAKKMFNQQVAIYSSLIWLFTLFTFQKYTTGFSYDTPVSFFWGLTAYWFYCGFSENKDRYFYLAGISSGFMLLSKYTGFLLFLSLFLLMLCSKPYRQLFKKPAVYIAALIALLVFSPVLLWNHQHSGGSLLFQFNHGFAHALHWKQLGNYIGILLGNYNVYFLIFVYFTFTQFKNIYNNEKLIYCWFLSITTVIVFACIAPFSIKYNWMETFYLTTTILVAYYCLQNNFRYYLLLTFITLNAVVLFGFAIGLAMDAHKKVLHGRYAEHHLYSQLNRYAFKAYPIFVPNYDTGANVSFYDKRHPKVIGFDLRAHQYGYWGAAVVNALKAGKQKYFYMISESHWTSPIKANCKQVFTASLAQQRQPNKLFVEFCKT